MPVPPQEQQLAGAGDMGAGLRFEHYLPVEQARSPIYAGLAQVMLRCGPYDEEVEELVSPQVPLE